MLSPLEEIHRQLGAHFFGQDGLQLVRDYGDAQAEYLAITNESGVIDLARYGVMRVNERECLAVLSQILKTDLMTMPVGSGERKLVMDATGQPFADVIVLAKENEFWVYSSRRALGKLEAYVHSAFPIESPLRVEPSEAFAILSVQGAFASDTLGRSIGKTIVLGEFNWGAMRFFDDELVIVKHARTGADGFDILVPREHAAILWEILTSNHARPAGLEALNMARLDAGLPVDD